MTVNATGSTDDARRGILLCASGILILSPDGLLFRLVRDAGIADVIFYRSIFMSMVLALILWALNRDDWRRPWRGFGSAGVIATLLMAASNISFIAALEFTTVANVLVMLAVMPMFSAALGWLLMREQLPRRTWIAILAAFSGVIVICASSLGGGLLGIGLGLLTAFLQGLNLVILRRAENDVVLPALCASGLISGGVCFFFASPFNVTQHDLGVLAVMGLVVAPIALALIMSGTRYIPAAEVALFALGETVLGPFWVWLGVGEVPAVATWIGGAIVITAIVVNSTLALRSRT